MNERKLAKYQGHSSANKQGAQKRALPYGGQAAPRKNDAMHGENFHGEGRIREAVDTEKVLALWRACSTDKAQESLSQLCALAKDSRVAELLNEQVDRAKLRGLLSDNNPKVRKNAARLLGALAQQSDADALIDALEAEEIDFVVPSILLALGNAGGAGALAAVRAAIQSLSTADAEDKHVREAKEAATVALSRLSPRVPREFTGLKSATNIELHALEGCGEQLMGEASSKGLVPDDTDGNALLFKTQDYRALFALRCFEEAILPVGACALPPLDGKKAAIDAWAKQVAHAAQPFAELLVSCLSGEPPIPYRIELRGVLHEERGPLAHAIALALDSGGCTRNAPSSYDAELRLYVTGRQTLLYAKLFVPPDDRFSYRLSALPASINPVAAATLLRFALPYLKADARVLDPCCGSGTLLVERAKLLNAKELVGVDISADAVRIARGNTKAASVPVEILGGDMLTFRPRAPFDELIANLPFGTRVGTHDANAALYKGLFERLPVLLAKDGVAILYTTQRAPLLRLAETNGYRVVDQLRLEAGGLNPWAIIFKKS